MPAILQRGESRNMSSDKDNSKSEDHKDDDMKNDEGVDVHDEEADKSEEEEKEKKEPPKKRGAKAKEAKKKEESEDENEEEDDEEESGDDKVPLLDQPLEISGSRERKKVERFTEEFNEPKESKTVDIPKGKGTALGEIPRTEDYIKKFKAEALKPLHRILFNRVGKLTMVKNNIRKFTGFDFDKGTDQYEKKKNMLSKIEASTLKTVCCILDLERGGKRDDLAQRILNFLLEPKSSGKPVENRPKRNTAQKSNNKSYSESDEEDSEKRPARSKRTSGRKKNLKEATSEEEEEEEEEAEKTAEKPKPKGKKADKPKPSEEEEEVEEEVEEAESEGEPSSDESGAKANKGSRGRGNAKKPAPKKSNAKKVPSKKLEKKTAPKKKKPSKSEEDSSSEDEPLTKKVKAPPSDEEIKTYVKEILEGANLEEITMKTVCKQVYANYPDFDLAHKKDFIKTTVKSLIST